MNNRTFALSVDDFSSGRFNEVAEFIRENWPFANSPSENESLEILAKSLGYQDYGDARSKATNLPEPNFSLYINIAEKFGRLGLAPKDEKNTESMTGLELIAAAFSGDTFGAKFVETWPVKLLGRWNYDGKPCAFDHEILDEAGKYFDRLLTHTAPMVIDLNGRKKSTHTAASLISGLYPSLTLNDLEARSVGEFIDSEAAEALLQDVMPILLGEVLCVSEGQANKIVHATGMSMADIWALPRTEAGFPNLYDHMRARLPAILERKAADLFIAPRQQNGFYRLGDGAFDRQPMTAKKVDEGSFCFSVERDEIECPIFKTYTWTGQLREPCGRVISQISGTYIAGPARQDIASFDLISALDEMGDFNVDIVDFVLDTLQEEVLEESGVRIPKGDLNANMLFEDGNLITILRWERHADSKPGIGASLLSYCIGELKRKFKRDIHIAGSVQPYQYYRGAEMLPSVREQRFDDIDKISRTIIRVAELGNVVRVFLKGHVHVEPDATFQRYCGEHYLSHG